MSSLCDMAYGLIAVFEGEHLKAYTDTGGVLTNGIGNTHDVVPGSTITHAKALADFTRNVTPLLKMVTGKPVIAAAAYVSFGFNCGAGALTKVLAGSDTILNPIHATDRKGHTLAGLVSRRRLEQLLIEADAS